jgi:uncharacterized membrane protein YtjA (UPF0391 family)
MQCDEFALHYSNGGAYNAGVHPLHISEAAMLYWSIIFFIVAIIAAVLGFGGLASDTAYIAKILALVGLVLAVITFISSRRSHP